MGDLMDFFDPRKPINKVILKAPDFGGVRLSAFDEPPPDTDQHHVCSQEEWDAFINKEQQKLLDAGIESSVCGTSEIETVVRSDMDGIEGRSLNTMARTVAAHELTEDSVDLKKIYNFEHNEYSYKLPIIDMKERILSTVNGNQIVIISGPTGCGKSTQVPQYILDQHAMERKMVNIVVTQPRKIAASSVARRVCEERQWKIGGLVGYQVGLDRANKSPDTRLLYVTTGVLKRIIINRKNLNNYTHIILDEVHEREEDMDLVMLLCKKLLYTNSRGTKLILMSATLDEGKLRAYFASLVPRIGEVPAPVVSVGSKRNANTCFYLDKMKKLLRIHQLPEEDFIFDINRPMLNEMCILLSKLIITNLDGLEKKDAERKGEPIGVPGSVLVFLPGIQEISQVRECLIAKDIYSSKEYEWWIVPLHSSVSWEEQQVIYRTPPPGQRKIILSTNIAESSLTVPDIKYVVDFCLTKNVMSDKDTNYPRLMLDWACTNQLIQRNGRAGRVNRDGRVFALIPEFLKDSLPESSVPEMLRVPLTKVVLDVKMLDMGSPKELLALAMDPPEIQSLQRTIIELKEIGALLTTVGGLEVRDDGDLTVLGEIVAKLPLDVKLGKMIFLGHIFGVLEESIIMAAGLNGKSIFTAPFDKRVQAYKNKLYWANRTFSDCFAILLAYQSWEQRRVRGEFKGKDGQKRERDFCDTAFLQRKSLTEMSLLVEDITRSLKMAQIEPLQIQAPVKWEGEQKFLILRLVMFGAFYPNYFQKNVSSEVEINAHRVLQGRDPKTTVYLQGMDEKHSPYGAIYSGQIKSLFQECYKEEDKIDLTFDGRKIFVEFARSRADIDRKVDGFQQDPNSNLTGEVIHQTYVACKLRSGNLSNNRLKLKLYSSVELAEEKHAEWQKVVKKAQDDRLTATELGQVTPPGMEVTELEVQKVTHISSPSTFWVHTAESAAQDTRVGQIIYQVLSRCTEVPWGQLREGQLFLAPYKDPEEEETNFYRAKVSRVFGTTSVSVFFVDYGNMEVVNIHNLRVISSDVIREFPDLVSIPGLALECCLGGVQPNQLRNGKGLWDDEVVRSFKDLVYSHVGKINCKIFSVIKSCSGHSSFVVSLDTMVIKQEGNKSVDVKKQLLVDKLADVAVESYLSQEDHRERMRFTAYSSAMKTHLENPYSSLSLPNIASMKEDKSKQLISLNLHGPFNPLEHKVQCSYRTGSQKLCNVDPESVNAVLLDQSPSDPTDQWMVAAQVAMSPSSESLLIRNTSWMPAKPGLGSLATMIFSPQVELRGNKGIHKDKQAKGKHTRIIGYVAGLGPKTIFDKPLKEVTKSEKTHGYYPEHDMEVKLDVVISNGDVNVINKIRYWLNQMMMKSEDGIMHITQPKQLDAAQKGLQKNLVDLLSQERMTQMKTSGPCGREFRWNMMPSNDQLKSKVDKDIQSQYVYKMINGIKMDMSKDSEAVVEQLIKLYSLWDPLDVSPLPSHEVCPVCPGQLMLTTPRDLHYHLHTAAHKLEESLVIDTPDTAATSSVAGASSSISRR